MQENAQQPNTGLVFVDDYRPGIGFRVVSRIQQPTVNEILGYVDPANPDRGDGAVVDPTDWNGYLVDQQKCGLGNYNLVFLREGLLEEGQTYSFTTDAIFFSNSLQLLEARIRRGAGQAAGQDAGDETTEEGGTETQPEATTEETTTETDTTEEPTTTQTTTTTETTPPADGATTTAPDGTTATSDGTTTLDETTTPSDETTTAVETTEQVIVNATETNDG
ncbi:hypothetical protein [Halorussus pelagicus]|uniref:hypothetical protein n=1 Tax=Halorussus pelagicus TaxID=2505977 RepID=UPI000FFCA671|nr:hypothetical protein [Halorussus pelagicus]